MQYGTSSLKKKGEKKKKKPYTFISQIQSHTGEQHWRKSPIHQDLPQGDKVTKREDVHLICCRVRYDLQPASNQYGSSERTWAWIYDTTAGCDLFPAGLPILKLNLSSFKATWLKTLGFTTPLGCSRRFLRKSSICGSVKVQYLAVKVFQQGRLTMPPYSYSSHYILMGELKPGPWIRSYPR